MKFTWREVHDVLHEMLPRGTDFKPMMDKMENVRSARKAAKREDKRKIIPALGEIGEFKPCVVENTELRLTEVILRDEATVWVSRGPKAMGHFVDLGYTLDGELIGVKIWDCVKKRKEAPESAKSMDAPMSLEAMPDKIDGLEADLDSAVRVAWSHGAHDWVRANYPSHPCVVESKPASNNHRPKAGGEKMRLLEVLGDGYAKLWNMVAAQINGLFGRE